MSPEPRRPADAGVYRSAGGRRLRVVTLVSGVVVLAGVLAAGAWVWRAAGGPAGPEVAAGTEPSRSPAASPGPSRSPTPTVIEIGWVGDTTPGSKYGLPPDEGRAIFAQVRDELRAPDLMIANLEGTYSVPGPSKCDGSDSGLCFAFQAPPPYVDALRWSGVDFVSLANNHSHDYLASGLQQTETALKKVHIQYTGLPSQVTMRTVAGVRVAVVGFAPYSWTASLLDIPSAQDLVRRADSKADVVVVLMHAGAEGADRTHTPAGTETAFGENRGDPRAFSHAVVDAGADLVLGSGPHVIRGIERYKDRLIAYSLGNFAGWDNFGLSGNLRLSGLLTVRIDAKGHIKRGRWLSLRLVGPGVPVVDPTHRSARLVRELSAADFPKTWPMAKDGTIAVP